MLTAEGKYGWLHMGFEDSHVPSDPTIRGRTMPPRHPPLLLQIRERQRVQQANRTGESHDAFMREVDVQGFALVAEYFGKGVFQKVVKPLRPRSLLRSLEYSPLA